MDEYIERESLIRHLNEQKATPPEMCYTFAVIDSVQDFVKNQPPADVAPVVHGLWLPEHHKDKVSQTEYHSYIWYHCSECGRRLIGYRDPRKAPYCHCGAKMDLD